MKKSLGRNLLWMAWAMPVAALAAVVALALLLPLSLGVIPEVGGNLSLLWVPALASSMSAPICILSWLPLTKLLPNLDRDSRILILDSRFPITGS